MGEPAGGGAQVAVCRVLGQAIIKPLVILLYINFWTGFGWFVSKLYRQHPLASMVGSLGRPASQPDATIKK